MSSDATVEERALARISVAPPYFDLGGLEEVGDGIVNATVPLQPPTAPEFGAVEAAQVARHLAILGSCALALGRDDDKRHHYLATRAHYTRMANAPATTTEPLRAQAIGSWIDKRTARAMVTLSTADGRGLNLLDVEYTVLAPRMFGRLNPPIDLDAIDGIEPEPETVERIDGGLRVDAGPIPVEMCAGHFPDYPAAPVAIVMGRLCRAAGLAMIDHLGLAGSGQASPAAPTTPPAAPGPRYRIEEGRVEATGLARAGQRLVLEVNHGEPVPVGHRMEGRALADGEVVGQVDVVLSVHGPAVATSEIVATGAGAGDDADDAYRDALVDV